MSLCLLALTQDFFRAKERVRQHARRVLELRERQRRLHETVKTDSGEVILVPASRRDMEDEENPFAPGAYDPQTNRTEGTATTRGYASERHMHGRDPDDDMEDDEGDEDEGEWVDEGAYVVLNSMPSHALLCLRA